MEREKYQPEKDISLSIFITNMELRFKELGVLKALSSEQEKIDYVYNSILDDLALRSNAIIFKGLLINSLNCYLEPIKDS